jgi:hypothetical protein
MSVDDIRTVLRALAEVRNTDFYPLWTELLRTWLPDPMPEIEFRIDQIADGADGAAVVCVGATRFDGTEFVWGLRLLTRSGNLVVESTIGTRSPDGASSDLLFKRSEQTQDPVQAADLIRTLAAEVCQRRY